MTIFGEQVSREGGGLMSYIRRKEAHRSASPAGRWDHQPIRPGRDHAQCTAAVFPSLRAAIAEPVRDTAHQSTAARGGRRKESPAAT